MAASEQVRQRLTPYSRGFMRLLASAFLALLACGSAVSQAQPAKVTVDLNNKLGPYKPAYAWFGYDEGNFSTMHDGKVLLRELRDLSPVPVQVRVHHLLTSGNGVAELKWSSTNVYREDASGKPIYDFTILDGIFDEFKAAGVTPMVELGFMPKDLTSGTNDYQVHYPARPPSGGVKAPPKASGRWQDLVQVFTDPLLNLFGASPVRACTSKSGTSPILIIGTERP